MMKTRNFTIKDDGTIIFEKNWKEEDEEKIFKDLEVSPDEHIEAVEATSEIDDNSG